MLARERHRNLLNVEPSLFIGRILSILLTHFFLNPYNEIQSAWVFSA